MTDNQKLIESFCIATRSFDIFKLDENLHVVLNIAHVKLAQ